MSTLSVPYAFIPNTTIISGQVNSNFSSIVNFTNNYCAIVNNPNVFSAPITVNSVGGLTLGSSATLTPLSVYGTSSFYNSVTVGTSASPQNTILNGNLTATGATTLSGPNTLSGGLTQDLVGTSGFNGGVKWPFPSGTRLIFNQATVPPGWTQDTTVQNDSLLRMVNGAGGGVYTGVGYSTVLHGNATSDGTAISISQMPGHNHGVNDPGHTHQIVVEGGGSTGGVELAYDQAGTGSATSGSSTPLYNASTGISIQNNGGGAAHNHSLSALNVNSIDIIVGVKS